MAEPVRIADLARQMIQLSGASVRDAGNPDGDIEIHDTALGRWDQAANPAAFGSAPSPAGEAR